MLMHSGLRPTLLANAIPQLAQKQLDSEKIINSTLSAAGCDNTLELINYLVFELQ